MIITEPAHGPWTLDCLFTDAVSFDCREQWCSVGSIGSGTMDCHLILCGALEWQQCEEAVAFHRH